MSIGKQGFLAERVLHIWCFLLLLTTSEIKSRLQVVICGFQHLSCTKLAGNADDQDCDPEFNSLLNRKPGEKARTLSFSYSVLFSTDWYILN